MLHPSLFLYTLASLLFASIFAPCAVVTGFGDIVGEPDTESSDRLKILALSGGGQDARGMSQMMSDLVEALPAFEFVFVDGAYGVVSSPLWIPDPPSKDEPTTDVEIAIESERKLEDLIASEGPFYGILGYSQGSAFATYFLARHPEYNFDKVMLFCGYIPETHFGLSSIISRVSPISGYDTLIWSSHMDEVIPPAMTSHQASMFLASETKVLSSYDGGHFTPSKFDETFTEVVDWIADP